MRCRAIHYFVVAAVLFIYFFLASACNAIEFVKYPANPLTIKYINNYSGHLQTSIFKEGSIFKGIFAINKETESYYSLGYFESTDGLDWEMKKEILNTGEELASPRALKTQTGYSLFISRTDSDGIYRIYSSSCDQNFVCSSNLIPVISPIINNITENKGVFAGFPIMQQDRTYLFFGAWGNNGFKIKLAYSDNLVDWYRCPNDRALIIGSDGAFPSIENNNLLLFYHQSNGSGIKYSTTTLPLTCDSNFADQGYAVIPDKPYDQNHIIFPSIVELDGKKLYYTGRGTDGNWRLNLTCSSQSCLVPTPTPTPVPAKTKIIVIPGLFGSWNRDAVLHNEIVPYTDWKLSPIVHEYDGIDKSLENLGYIKNKDYFLFTYDWRKGISSIADDLEKYVKNILLVDPESTIDIVGHSLGGLVGRVYIQKYQSGFIHKLVTVGSPHQGVAQVYKAVEAGEFDNWNDLMWLGEKLILQLYRNNIQTDKDVMQEHLPVLKDLLPTYNFLKNQSGQDIQISQMKIQNETLLLFNATIPSIFQKLSTVVGEKANTLSGFVVKPKTTLDQLLNNYPDGRPDKSTNEIGDYTVVSKSANAGINSSILQLDHGELIYSKTGIKSILDTVGIGYDESKISEGLKTNLTPSLLFFMLSPATMKVEYNGNTYFEKDGIVFIEDAQGGNYQLIVTGVSIGSYKVIVGQIGRDTDLWEEINGKIINEPPSSQVDNYLIEFDDFFPRPIASPLSLLDEITADINTLNYSIPEIGYVRNDLKLAKKYLENNDLKKLHSILLLVHSRLMIIRDKINGQSNKDFIFKVIDKLENVFIVSLQDYVLDQKTNNSVITTNNGYRKILNELSNRLISLQTNGTDISKQLSMLHIINSKLQSVTDYINYKKYSNALIVLKTVGYLINDIKKITN